MDQRWGRGSTGTGCLRAAALLAGLLPTLAWAGSAGPDYPLTARLRLSPAAGGARFSPPSARSSQAAAPAVEVPVGEQARYGYVLALNRMFIPAGTGQADLEVEVAEVGAGAERDADGWRLVAEHTVVVRGADGAELARWKVKGEARPVNETAGAMTVGLNRAAVAAAERFEFEFEAQPGIADLLAGRGIPLLGDRRRPPRELPRPLAERPRAASAAYVDLGPFVVDGGDDLAGGFGIRAGVSGPRLLFQFAGQWWAPASSTSAVTAARAMSVGAEVGAQARIGRGIALRAGLGPHAVIGSATYGGFLDARPGTATRVTLGGFAAVEATLPVGADGLRLRVTLEARALADTTLTFGQETKVDVGGSAIGLLLGGELPWRWRFTPSASPSAPAP